MNIKKVHGLSNDFIVRITYEFESGIFYSAFMNYIEEKNEAYHQYVLPQCFDNEIIVAIHTESERGN